MEDIKLLLFVTAAILLSLLLFTAFGFITVVDLLRDIKACQCVGGA